MLHLCEVQQCPCHALSFSSAPANWCWRTYSPPPLRTAERRIRARGYSHDSHSERPPPVGEGALLPQWLGAMDVGDGYENCRYRWSRGLFSITRRYTALQYTPTAIAPKGYEADVPETKLSFQVLPDQTPHSKSKSPNMQRGATVAIVPSIAHCRHTGVCSQPAVLK